MNFQKWELFSGSPGREKDKWVHGKILRDYLASVATAAAEHGETKEEMLKKWLKKQYDPECVT